MDISEVLSRAWQIIWRHKVLWIFGILASCSGGGNGGNNFRYLLDRPDVSNRVQPYIPQAENLPTAQIVLLAIIALVVILALVALIIFLGTIGRIGLIRGTMQAEEGAGRLSLGDLFNGSFPYFWRIFGLSLLFGLIAIAVVVVSIPVGIITCGLGFILMILVFALIAIIQEQASNAIVIENIGALDGLRRGWELVRANLGPVVLMGIILAIIGFVGGLIVAAPILLILLPVFVGAGVGAAEGSRALFGGGVLLGLLCLVAYLPVLIVLAGILRTYTGSAWTLTYMRLARR